MKAESSFPEPIFSKNQHMKIGYNGSWFNLRQNATDTWSVSYGKIQRPPLDYRTECSIAAEEIFKLAQRPLFLGFSGGVDSEVVAESLRIAGIPFAALIMRFPNSLNNHDICFAESYCQRWKIPCHYFDIDPLDYYKSTEFKNRTAAVHCLYPMLALQAKALEYIDKTLQGFGIMGGGDFLFAGAENQPTIIKHHEISGSVLRLQFKFGIPGIYRFFRWSPELVASFFLDPTIQELLQATERNRDFNSSVKLKFYQTHFTLMDRPKYYGWENFSDVEDQIRTELRTKFFYATTILEHNEKSFLKLLGV